MERFVEQHSGEITILLMGVLVAVTLLILVPQLLRAQQAAMQFRHTEAMRALEQGVLVPSTDDKIRFAGRTASLVPMVVVCSAGIVTCFLAAYRSESLFAVTLTVEALGHALDRRLIPQEHAQRLLQLGRRLVERLGHLDAGTHLLALQFG